MDNYQRMRLTKKFRLTEDNWHIGDDHPVITEKMLRAWLSSQFNALFTPESDEYARPYAFLDITKAGRLEIELELLGDLEVCLRFDLEEACIPWTGKHHEELVKHKTVADAMRKIADRIEKAGLPPRTTP